MTQIRARLELGTWHCKDLWVIDVQPTDLLAWGDITLSWITPINLILCIHTLVLRFIYMLNRSVVVENIDGPLGEVCSPTRWWKNTFMVVRMSKYQTTITCGGEEPYDEIVAADTRKPSGAGTRSAATVGPFEPRSAMQDLVSWSHVNQRTTHLASTSAIVNFAKFCSQHLATGLQICNNEQSLG